MQISYKEYIDKSFKNTPQVYFDYFYRRLSHPITFVLLRLGLTPNNFSLISIVLSVLGGIILMLGWPLAGLLVLISGYVFDFCDGNAARVVMKTAAGMAEKKQKYGLLIENFNTNISLLMMYAGLGFYFISLTKNYWPLLLGFMIFGIKMAVRYSAHQFSSIFKNDLAVTATNDIQKTNNILRDRIKFFLRKSLFSSNFYLAVYLLGFLFLGKKVVILFLVYAVLDGLFSLIRLFRIFFWTKV